MKKVLIISFLIFTFLFSLFSTSYATVKKEDADYVITLKVGQKCQIVTNTSIYGYSIPSSEEYGDGDIVDFADFNWNEFTANALGTCTILLNIGTEQKLIYLTVEENTQNETLSPKILKIEDDIPDRLNITDITKETADYCVELNVGETHNISIENSGYSLDNSDSVEFDYSGKITALKSGIVRGYIYEKVNEFKSTTKYMYISITEKATTSSSDNSKNNTNIISNITIEKLPQTGDSFGLKDGLFFLILACAVSIIIFSKYKNYKNIDNK